MSDGYRWKALGARIREPRVRAGLTQKRLAEFVGVRPHTACCWEAGRMRPQRDNLVAIAHHTGTSPEQIEGRDAGEEEVLYNPATGRREIEPFQAAVVRRIFERYADSRSFSSVSNELNDAAIPAFSGGRWYPITIRRVLLNEAYIGRTVYRRTRRVPVRAPGARRRTRVVERPEHERIEIPGATPAIIDDELWARVQAILSDPERTSRRPVAKRRYALRGRLRCGLCQSAMVGQTLSPNGKRYAYYRCRHAYTKSTSRACTARYIPAEALEQEIRDEVRKVLTAPEVILQELKQPDDSADAREAIQRLESEMATLKKREERLVRLFGYDEVDSTVVRAELREAQRQREVLSAELETLARPASAIAAGVDEDGLREVCASIAARLDGAEPEQYERVMEAVQLSVSATRDEVTVEGLLPTEPPESTESPDCPPECTDFDAGVSPLNKHRHHCSPVTNGGSELLPFRRTFTRKPNAAKRA